MSMRKKDDRVICEKDARRKEQRRVLGSAKPADDESAKLDAARARVWVVRGVPAVLTLVVFRRGGGMKVERAFDTARPQSAA